MGIELKSPWKPMPEVCKLEDDRWVWLAMDDGDVLSRRAGVLKPDAAKMRGVAGAVAWCFSDPDTAPPLHPAQMGGAIPAQLKVKPSRLSNNALIKSYTGESISDEELRKGLKDLNDVIEFLEGVGPGYYFLMLKELKARRDVLEGFDWARKRL